MNLRRWLAPGIGVKRWLLVAFAGLLLLAVGVAHVLRQVSADLSPGDAVGAIVDAVTLQWLPYQVRGLVAGVLGVTLFVVRRLSRSSAPSSTRSPPGTASSRWSR